MQTETEDTSAMLAIDRFNQADLALLLAVSLEHEEQILCQLRKFDDAKCDLFEARPITLTDRTRYARFLGERFLLCETCPPGLKQEAMGVLERLIAEPPTNQAR